VDSASDDHFRSRLVSACARYDFDPLDVTKIWPEDVFPLQPVGRMVLNRNVDNFFNENEMLAFCPGVIVPGQLAQLACAATFALYCDVRPGTDPTPEAL
jgi:Catalase